jgi:flagellar biosynthesis protein FlhF
MKIKRFFAKDMRQAIRNVREELGPDAVILSNRKVNGGIEIVSAIDYDESLFSKMSATSEQAQADTASDSQDDYQDAIAETEIQNAYHTEAAPRQAEWMEDPMLIQMRHELKHLRGVLENQLSQFSQTDLQRREPGKAAIIQRLEHLGMDNELSQAFAATVPADLDSEQGWHQVLATLSHQLQVTDDDILTRGGVVALVGPTGVGKTTSVAKLAARYSLRHGNRQVALISTDNYRIGAQEQLLNFGRILDVPTYAVGNAKELSERIRDLADKRLVLIDTAGMSQRDIHLSEQLQTLSESASRIRTYLVMAANTQASTLHDVMRTFHKSHIEGCILTKIDETTSLGGALSAIIRYHLPIAYLSDGQRVPEDMHPARAHALVSRAVSMMKELEIRSEKYHKPININRKVANAHV